MRKTSLSPDELFGDLDLEPPAPLPVAKVEEALPGSFAHDAEAMLDQVGFTPASALLCDGEPSARATQPYDILADEFAQVVSLWGDDERFSAMSTTPLALDDLPAEAYPTMINLFEAD